MSQRTAFLGRLIGAYSILVSLSMITHKQATIERVTALLNNPPLLFLVGVMAVIPGLAMVLGHNVWSGGPLPVIVTVIGWLTLIKGALFLFLSPEAESGFFLGALHYQQYFYLYVSIGLVLGIYLTYGGTVQRRAQSAR
jgi:hypothetical protein